MFLAQAGDGSGNPVGAVGVDGEAMERPDQQSRNDNPLSGLDELGDAPSKARTVRSRKPKGAVDEVEGEEGQAVSQPTVATSYIEGDGNREDDGEQEDGAGEDAKEPPHRRVGGGWLPPRLISEVSGRLDSKMTRMDGETSVGSDSR